MKSERPSKCTFLETHFILPGKKIRQMASEVFCFTLTPTQENGDSFLHVMASQAALVHLDLPDVGSHFKADGVDMKD